MKGEKCAWKNFIDLEKYILGFNFSMGSRYYFAIGVRENYIFWKKIPTREKNQICTRETEFSTHEKKPKECPWKKQVGVKKTEKSVRENIFLPVKKSEKNPKRVFTGTFYFHGEKKNTEHYKGRRS